MGRSPCCEKSHTNKGAWTKEEDHRLITYVRHHGEGCWRSLPKAAGLMRCGKSCRLRWINYLRPDLKRGNFTREEDDIIIKLHSLLGNKWSLIAGRLPGRTDNKIKNYWNTHIKRKLITSGIDPQTHRSLNTITTINVSPAYTCLDFRNPSPKLETNATKQMRDNSSLSSSVDQDTKCNSSTTHEPLPPLPEPMAVPKLEEHDSNAISLDLGLSIGLPFQSSNTSSVSFGTRTSAEYRAFYDFLLYPATAEVQARKPDV